LFGIEYKLCNKPASARDYGADGIDVGGRVLKSMGLARGGCCVPTRGCLMLAVCSGTTVERGVALELKLVRAPEVVVVGLNETFGPAFSRQWSAAPGLLAGSETNITFRAEAGLPGTFAPVRN
jgi:hypothetical protein